VLDSAGLPLPAGARRTPEWQTRLTAFLASAGQWKRSEATSDAEFFQEKCSVYRELLSLAEGPGRAPIMRALLEFALSSPVRKTNRVEWFLALNSLFARMSLDLAGLASLAEELRNSKDPLVALYGNLEAVAPRTAERVLPIL
jgi:hypothetical protein